MPAYRVEISTSAERDADRLALTLYERVMGQITALGGSPRPPGSQKLSGVDAYRIRVGDHRVIYKVDDATRTVIVQRVRHRRDVYRKLR